MTRLKFLRFLIYSFLGFLLSPVKSLAQMAPRVFDAGRVTSQITSVSKFYVEDYSGPPASLKENPETWSLRLHGMVKRELVFTYPQLLKRPTIKMFATINCIGNPVGGGAIGNALWEGVSLASLLDEANPDFFADVAAFKGADDYHDSIPLRQARHSSALLALKMNGRPLTLDHGFPLRLVVPGLYGIKQMKWIREIEIGQDDREGYWQKRGWSKKARVKIFSRIDHPRDGDWIFQRSLLAQGVAFAGDRGVQYVQVSSDGEKTWALAKLEPPLSDYSWARWSVPISFNKPGRYQLSVRGADQYGGVQRDDLRDPFPSGTSGVHRVNISVA